MEEGPAKMKRSMRGPSRFQRDKQSRRPRLGCLFARACRSEALRCVFSEQRQSTGTAKCPPSFLYQAALAGASITCFTTAGQTQADTPVFSSIIMCPSLLY